MPGRCSDCGVICLERADDGKYYCDRCWQQWLTSTDQEKAAWESRRRQQRDLEAKAQLEAQAREKENLRQRENETKEKAYWVARELAEASIKEVVTSEAVDSDVRIPVVFWGICDVKYDPRLERRDRIKVLELGDGRASRFSHHGAVIKQRFDGTYCMDQQPLRRGVLVDNKKLTHDAFLDHGFGFLRPRQRSYPRRYSPDLAARIAKEFEASADDVVVLKLVNRARGAGVVVCPIRVLDATLKRLLQPPVGRAVQQWLEEHAPMALKEDRSRDVLAEQALHYWSNESPVFVVEESRHSLPVPLPPKEDNGHAGGENGSREVFDGTLRVAYALRRSAQEDGKLDIDWLGGYWKLPPLPAAPRSGANGGTGGDLAQLEEAQARLVSSFNTEEKRTAPVDREHLLEVYAALTPALSTIFEVGNFGVRDLTFSYPEDPSFRAFAMVRCGASMRSTGDLSKSSWTVEQAKRVLRTPSAHDLTDIPERSVLSYAARTLGVNHALRGDWLKAGQSFLESQAWLPTNSSAYYLWGLSLQEEGRYQEAVDSHLRSVALDPDFRSPMISLGECWARLGDYAQAVEACEVCLHRQPDAPVAQFNMGQAIYQQLRRGVALGPPEEVAALRAKGKQALEVARAGRPDLWTPAEEDMLKYFDEPPSEQLPLQPLRSWKHYGWRF